MPRTVAIVFDADFSEQLEKTAFHMPVWLADTPANRAAAEEAWRAAIEWPHITVTLFRPPGAVAAREDWRMLLEEISIRERSVEAIDVTGSFLTELAREALVESGYTKFEETMAGFRARKF
ncbi:MAG TPA: hypothetical protein VEK57_31705 [Thermoanaerobaculia bacterium]|nr:hypothetical protein [Thermoanaerobaculia bacterium]